MDSVTSSGVIYEIVSNVPKASEELEDRESLAQLAASGEDVYSADGETYMEKYTKSVGAVESILTLDRLRQNLAVKELLQSRVGAKSSSSAQMRKTLSVPNLSQLLRWQEENSTANPAGRMGRSESLANFAAEIFGIQANVTLFFFFFFRLSYSFRILVRFSSSLPPFSFTANFKNSIQFQKFKFQFKNSNFNSKTQFNLNSKIQIQSSK